MKTNPGTKGHEAAPAHKPSWIGKLLSRRAGRSPASPAFEALESRLVLAGTPFPTLGMLENPGNSVVRLETNFGDIDIELFNNAGTGGGAAPISVANFLNYVTSGRLDETFFHRSAISPQAFVLQGGGFSYDDIAGRASVVTDPAIIREDTLRNNAARTVAFARGDDVASATSQFFINYVDNFFLDPTNPNNGYAVFGRVIQGWNVVTEIQGLRSLDLSGDAAFAPQTTPTPFGEVPVSDSYTSVTGVRENVLINLINAELIKPASTSDYFLHRLVFPEGYRSGSVVETLDLVNNTAFPVEYQVITHFEFASRDRVIFSGSIAPNSTLHLPVSDHANSSLNLVRTNTPYGLFVESALPLSGSFYRSDFNAGTSEALFKPGDFTETQLKTWDFPRIERNDLSREFILWQSLADSPATITTTFTTSSGTRVQTSFVEAYRRGGLDLALLGLPTGVMSARITSTQPIAVSLSDWDTPAAGVPAATAYTPGFAVLGQPGGGATTGAIADARIQTGFSNIITIFNPTQTVAVVTLNYWRTGRPEGELPITRFEFLTPGQRLDSVIDPTTVMIPLNEAFTVTYSSGSAPIAVQYTSIDEVGRSQSTGKVADGFSTMFQTSVGATSSFGGGEMDTSRNDTTQVESISIFNPFANVATTFTYTIRFRFSDGTVIDGPSDTISANGRVDVNVGNLSAVRAKAGSAPQFRNYAITVTGQGVNGSTTTNSSGIVQFTRVDTVTGRSITSLGLSSAPGRLLSDPVFGTN